MTNEVELNDTELQQASGGLNDPEHPVYGLGSYYMAFLENYICHVIVSSFLGNINGDNMYKVSYTITAKGSGGMMTPMHTNVTEKQIQDKVFLTPNDAKRG